MTSKTLCDIHIRRHRFGNFLLYYHFMFFFFNGKRIFGSLLLFLYNRLMIISTYGRMCGLSYRIYGPSIFLNIEVWYICVYTFASVFRCLANFHAKYVCDYYMCVGTTQYI